MEPMRDFFTASLAACLVMSFMMGYIQVQVGVYVITIVSGLVLGI